MRTVESKWRNVTKGHDRALECEIALQVKWAPQVEQAQRQKYQADLNAWKSRQEHRVNEHQHALSVWTQTVSDQRSRLRATTGSDIRRGVIVVPVSALLFMATALLGIVDINAIQLIFLGICVGLVIAFTPAAWSGIQFAQLLSRKPTLKAMEDPMPQEEEPIHLAVVDYWWRKISDNDTHQSEAQADYGDVGEEEFYRHLAQSLPDDHVAIRGILVRSGLDVDLLVVGPTNVWIFEVKHWSGTISCRNGNWWRSKSYYGQGGYLKHDQQKIKSFDRQWMRERKEVEETLRRHVRPSQLADRIAGGLVFTHPNVTLDIDKAQCGFGPPAFWATHLQEMTTGHQEAIALPFKLIILDALLDRAERIDYGHAKRYCCIELAEQIASDMTDWAEHYVGRHSSS